MSKQDTVSRDSEEAMAKRRKKKFVDYGNYTASAFNTIAPTTTSTAPVTSIPDEPATEPVPTSTTTITKPSVVQKPKIQKNNLTVSTQTKSAKERIGNGRIRSEIRPGSLVDIVLKADQPTGKLTRGVVADLLTNSSNHPQGIKVRLNDGKIGRVQAIYRAN
jgi:uncharacterized repeat protein (TIGR03833 family)